MSWIIVGALAFSLMLGWSRHRIVVQDLQTRLEAVNKQVMSLSDGILTKEGVVTSGDPPKELPSATGSMAVLEHPHKTLHTVGQPPPTEGTALKTKEKCQEMVLACLEATFGGKDPALEASAKALVETLFNEDVVKAPPKKSLLTVSARTCHDCKHRGEGKSKGVLVQLCLASKSIGTADMYNQCPVVIASLSDPSNCPAWVKKAPL